MNPWIHLNRQNSWKWENINWYKSVRCVTRRVICNKNMQKQLYVALPIRANSFTWWVGFAYAFQLANPALTFYQFSVPCPNGCVRTIKQTSFILTGSNGYIFCVTGPLCGNSPVTGEFPSQRPVMRNFDAFFDLRLNKRLNKQPWCSWFWRHRGHYDIIVTLTFNFIPQQDNFQTQYWDRVKIITC